MLIYWKKVKVMAELLGLIISTFFIICDLSDCMENYLSF